MLTKKKTLEIGMYIYRYVSKDPYGNTKFTNVEIIKIPLKIKYMLQTKNRF